MYFTQTLFSHSAQQEEPYLTPKSSQFELPSETFIIRSSVIFCDNGFKRTNYFMQISL